MNIHEALKFQKMVYPKLFSTFMHKNCAFWIAYIYIISRLRFMVDFHYILSPNKFSKYNLVES